MLAAGNFWMPQTAEPARGKIRAILFDGFALFDPRPVSFLTEEIFPGKGKEITDSMEELDVSVSSGNSKLEDLVHLL
jgi:hypothetical protein